jgi:hypothetical protein
VLYKTMQQPCREGGLVSRAFPPHLLLCAPFPVRPPDDKPSHKSCHAHLKSFEEALACFYRLPHSVNLRPCTVTHLLVPGHFPLSFLISFSFHFSFPFPFISHFLFLLFTQSCPPSHQESTFKDPSHSH